MSDVHINMKCPASLAPVTMWGGWIWISQSEVSTLPHWPMRGRRAGYWGWHILMVLVPGAKFRVRLYRPVSPRVAACRPGPCSPSCKSCLPRGRPDTNWTLGSNPGFKSDKLKPSSHYWHTQVLRKKDWRIIDEDETWDYNHLNQVNSSEVRSYCQLVGYQNRSEAYILIFDQYFKSWISVRLLVMTNKKMIFVWLIK